MNGFENILTHLLETKHEWNDFINGNWDLPEAFVGMHDFNQIVLYKILKPEKASSLIQRYVLNKLGEFYAYPPINTIKDSYSDSDYKTPLIFILTPGNDPMADL